MADISFDELKTSAGSEFEDLKKMGSEGSFLGDVGGGVMAGMQDINRLVYSPILSVIPGTEKFREEQLAGGAPQTTLGGQIGEEAIEALSLGGVGGALATTVKAAAPVATGLGSAVRNFLNTVGVSVTKAPKAFLGAEALTGGTAGAGGFIAEQKYPESEGARVVGEILGGFTPAGVTGITKTAVDISLVGKVLKMVRTKFDSVFSTEGAMSRAQRRIQRAGEDIPTTLDGEFIPGLTVAGKARSEGLANLTAAVNKQLDDADKFLEKSNVTTNENIAKAIKSFGDDPDKSAKFFEEAQKNLSRQLDERLQIAAARAETKIARLAPDADIEQVNRIAAQEIDKAFTASRAQEASLYKNIPVNAVVPTGNAKSAFLSFKSELSQAEVDDLPDVAKRLLGEKGLGNLTTIKEMRGLQSKLREVARNSRAGDTPNFSKARIADGIANAITDDIANAQGGEAVSGAVKIAVDFSREQAKKFKQGTVGSLLGYTKQGAARVPEGLFLDKSLGLPKGKSREAFDDIMKATDSPEVKGAVDDYIKNRFIRSTEVNGEFSPRRAEIFINNNEEILKRLPEVRQELIAAKDAASLTDFRLRQKNRVDLINPKNSRTTLFIQKGPQEAFQQVLSSRSPKIETKKLVNMANKDTTGEALQGLKAAFSDVIYQKSRTGEFISGSKLSETLNDPKTIAVMEQLFTPAEKGRWKTIQRTAKALDIQRLAKSSGEILDDKPSAIMMKIAGFMGAAYGAGVSKRMGVGTIQIPGQMADSFREALKKGIDPAQRLIIEAVQDEQLFKDVLMSPLVNGKLSKKATRTLNAWLATTLEEEE